ncbi:DEAD/DEAH box helicase family protein, partial [Vibrio parahaemolyticus V-223/04]
RLPRQTITVWGKSVPVIPIALS